MVCAVLALLLVSASAQPNAIPEKFIDCAVRRAAFAFAQHLQPARNNSDVFDALQLGAYCGTPPPRAPAARAAPAGLPAAARSFYCDAAAGSDAAAGTEAAPFATVERGVAACRGGGGGGAGAAPPGCLVVLRGGAPFFLRAPLALDGRDSGLTIAAYPGEAPVLSGGAPLAAAWERVPSALPGANIWRARAPLPVAPGALLVAGKRQPRARWPNGDADTDTVPAGWANASEWLPRPPGAPPAQLPGNFSRPEDHFFPSWVWGVNGSAAGAFDPPEGYWLAPAPAGGATWAVPGAFVFRAAAFSPRAATWARPTAAVVHAFHGAYWGSWQFAVAGVRALNGSFGRVDLGAGGWQEARGWPSGGALYVDNVAEELDAPGEWYYDGENITLWHNSSGPPAAAGAAAPVAAQLECLINATASGGAPLANLSLVGLTFTATQPTFLSRRFRAPSGGDWSFSESAAVVLSHTQGARVAGCAFSALGGNGVLVSGANLGARVEGSAFSRLGESGVVACGERGILQDLRGRGVPVGTTVVGNVFSELGVFVKQSGAFYAALSANSTVARNVAFNLPRAAVNVNDGAHGGHAIEGNLFFQTVRETQDHGAINTWEREPYLRGFSPAGAPLLYGATSRCTRNFLVCDGFGIHCLDHDDGSNNWADEGNVVAWAGVKNYLGFNKTARGNLFVRPDFDARRAPGMHPGASASGVPLPAAFYFPACVRTLGQWAWGPALADSYVNNTCLLGATSNPYIFGAGTCNPAAPAASGALPSASGNTYFAPNGSVAIACGAKTLTLAEAAAAGWEVGSAAVSNAAFGNDAAGAAALEALIRGFLGI
jgi:hypothetical protein